MIGRVWRMLRRWRWHQSIIWRTPWVSPMPRSSSVRMANTGSRTPAKDWVGLNFISNRLAPARRERCALPWQIQPQLSKGKPRTRSNQQSDAVHLFEDGLLDEPVPVRTFAVLGEVLFEDGLAFEIGGHEGLDLRQGVEPLDEALTWFGVAEALIELFSDFVGEAGDFSPWGPGMGGGHGFLF
ncbi:hypothetical protein SBV1_1750022 [Verrucomicrobia bacterium]|nr:hypothetical protein SBV1_1750022 [Verrucomicrobiota bacterium]